MRLVILLLALPLLFSSTNDWEANYETVANNVTYDCIIEIAELQLVYHEAAENLKTEIRISELIGNGYRGYEAVVGNPAAVIVTNRKETTLKALERSKGKFAVNGGGFVEKDPIGNTVVESELIGAFKSSRHRWDIFIGFDSDNNLIGGRVNSHNELMAMGPVHGISFGPALVVDGEPQHLESKDLQPRTAVGQLVCGSLLFIVIDGRQPGWSRGITINDLRDIFIDRGAVNAFNLDGGGSSTMVYYGKVLNRPSEGRLRVVANSIVIR